MGLMLDALKQMEVGAPPTPAVGAAVELPHQLGDPASRPPSPASRPPSSVERFAFPELPEPREQSPESPQVFWPECFDRETALACVETADGILRQLSLRRPTVVALTSPGDGDGKTSLLIALAPQFAKRTANNVLVVDANLRKPDLTARLNIPAALGWGGSCTATPGATVQLSPQQVLSPQQEAARSALIYPTNLPRLSVLPAFPWGGNPASWGGSCTATPWIEELREGWPLVLLDTPSLAHPEAAPMARCCDGVYLVVRLGHTARRAVAEAARLIRNAGGRLLGCVVVR